MSLKARHLISVADLSGEEIQAILELGAKMEVALGGGKELELGRLGDLARGKLLATVFYEPSTRTRLSFEAAMLRLGGQVVGFADALRASSAAKGESLADTMRVLGRYADLVVLRHPWDGAARLAGEYCPVPLINGGDGAREHPTQTLCDLYTLKKEKGQIRGLRVALCGDLRHARTVHSLALGLGRTGARLVGIAPPGLELPASVREELGAEGAGLAEYHCFQEPGGGWSLLRRGIRGRARGRLGDWRSPEATWSPQEGFLDLFLQEIDAFYFTRLQRERYTDPELIEAAAKGLQINRQLIAGARADALFLHALPRGQELPAAVDADPRAAYFRQAGYGVPVRMALIALMLGLVPAEIPVASGDSAPVRALPQPRVREEPRLQCPNPRCVSVQETQVTSRSSLGLGKKLRCYYCDEALPGTPAPQGISARSEVP